MDLHMSCCAVGDHVLACVSKNDHVIKELPCHRIPGN